MTVHRERHRSAGRGAGPADRRSSEELPTFPDLTILVIDNYDSFVYNLVQYVGEIVGAITVRRNDAVDIASIERMDPDGIVISPGPGTPHAAGISMPICAELDRPVLGVCLGHQAICAVNGLPVEHAPAVVHGKPSTIEHDGEGIFSGLPPELSVGRYHSLAVPQGSESNMLVESAWTTDEAVLMAVRHVDRPHIGVQFHPESILTDAGKRMIANFCEICQIENIS